METKRRSAAIYFFILSGIDLITAWYFNALAFVTAAAFTVPLFLAMRELKLAKTASQSEPAAHPA